MRNFIGWAADLAVLALCLFVAMVVLRLLWTAGSLVIGWFS